jgi:hypothetical protein
MTREVGKGKKIKYGKYQKKKTRSDYSGRMMAYRRNFQAIAHIKHNIIEGLLFEERISEDK